MRTQRVVRGFKLFVLFLSITGVRTGASFAQSGNANAGWTRQDSGTTNLLDGVFFLDSNRGWVVGANGTILHSSDGGDTWTAQDSGTSRDLHRVTFVDCNTGWAVGAGGTILHTIDGGATWTAQDSGTTDSLSGVSFVSACTGWAVGPAGDCTDCFGPVLYTTDGGATWARQNPGVPGGFARAGFAGVAFVNENDGIAVGTGVIRLAPREVSIIGRTSDGGATWSVFGFGSARSSRFNAIARASNTAVAVGFYMNIAPPRGGALIASSTDGGATWAETQIKFGGTFGGVSLGDAATGWAVGAGVLRSVIIYRTTDQGTTWTLQDSGTTDALTAISSVDANTAWAVGANGTILHTTTGGE